MWTAPASPHTDRAAWPALILAPLLALGHLSIAYALVTPACAAQSGAALHGLCLVSLVASLVMTLFAWRAWRRAGDGGITRSDGIEASSRAAFLALTSTLVGALSALVIAAMWVPVAVVPACTA